MNSRPSPRSEDSSTPSDRPADKPAPTELGSTLTRRRFVHRSGLAAVGAALAGIGPASAGAEDDETPEIPRVTLGRTGASVSLLGLGTACLGHQNGNKPDVAKLTSVFSEAIDRGITYLDTARIYGRAELALKRAITGRRDKLFVVTKAWAETYDQAKKSFEESLERLGTDHVDVLHIHNLGGKDVDVVLDDKRGSWKYLQEAKKAGKARFIGISGHQYPARYVRMLETGTVDVMMVVLNFVDRHIYGFDKTVLPVARRHGTGVMAMKVYGGLQGGWGSYSKPKPVPSRMEADLHEQSISFVKSLEGVHGMVIGVHTREQLVENIRRVVRAKPLTKEQLADLETRAKELAPAWKARFGPVT